MKKETYLFTIGEFAKLNGVNKRTLHFYDEIGLFSPEYKGDNGYRYYTCFQCAHLELILTLRRIGLSVEEIKEYLKRPAEESFFDMLSDKKQFIDATIKKLLDTKRFLEQKAERLELGMHARHGAIELLTLPEERILLSAPIEGCYDAQDFAVAAEFSLRLKQVFGLYDNFGSRIAAEHIRQGSYGSYDCFFIRSKEEIAEFDAIKPAGTYLRAFCIGGWEKLAEVYEDILKFAEEQELEICGYAYEEGLNEMTLQRREDYITCITVACRKKQG